MVRSIARMIILGAPLAILCSAPASAQLELGPDCAVSVLNRTAPVRADGTTWILSNVPASIGKVRARATCVRGGVTLTGTSDFFTVSANGSITIPPIVLGAELPVPASITVDAVKSVLTSIGATGPLRVLGQLGDGSTADLTAAASGTTYTTSNAAIVDVDADGLITAKSSGIALISALNEGALGAIRIQVVLPGTDSDGDGLSDALEQSQGMDANNAVDALEDFDGDGLSNRDELLTHGTKIRDADTDGDSINDGEEVATGNDGFVTNPLLADSDGDGVNDALEIQTGSDPNDPASVDLAAALTSLSITPRAFVLTFNDLFGDSSVQLRVIGQLKDGNTIDLTSTARGTNYTSSDLTRCNFGATAGEIFAGQAGTCTIAATNNGFTAQASGDVGVFTASVSRLGLANTRNVDVNGMLAYVAVGPDGLKIVDVTDPDNPQVVGNAFLPGEANDVKMVGNLAFVASGTAGLTVVDVTDPQNPRLIGSALGAGSANDVVVREQLAYVADGPAGLTIMDVGAPTLPVLVSMTPTIADALGVDVVDTSSGGRLAVVAVGGSGIDIIDVTDPFNPLPLGSVDTGTANDVVVRGTFAFVADGENSLTVVDISNPSAPRIVASTPLDTGGRLADVALNGNFAFGADFFFVNGVPVIDVSLPANPKPRRIIDFRSLADDDGTGIAADSRFVYMTAQNGLFIGQYSSLSDNAGLAPSADITSPRTDDVVVEGSRVFVSVDATDDVAVASVALEIDGTIVQTDTAAPYAFTVRAPLGVASATLRALAFDLAGSEGDSNPVVLKVIPDPGTQVVGTVITQNGDPLANAAVVCAGKNTVTASDGGFSLADAPTADGRIQCRVDGIDTTGAMVRGVSAPTDPVPGGITDIGLVITAAADVVWVGAPAGSWENPANWDGGVLPGADDDVFIAAGGVDALVTITGADVTVRSLTIFGSLSISGAALAVSAESAISGMLVLDPGATIRADGPAADFVVAGNAIINGATLFASGGGRVSLPGARSYAFASDQIGLLRAEGAGSVLDLTGLTELLGTGWLASHGGGGIQAARGGLIDMRNVTGVFRGGTNILADGPGSVVDLSGAATFDSTGSDAHRLTTSNGGVIRVGNVTSYSGATLVMDDPTGISTAQIALFTAGAATADGIAIDFGTAADISGSIFTLANGGTIDLGSAVNIDGASFTVMDGSTLSLPSARSYAFASDQIGLLRAEGAGSVLDLTGLTELLGTGWLASHGGGGIQAARGGLIDMRNVTGVFRGGTNILADGPGSVVDLSGAATFDSTGSDAYRLTATNNGVIDASSAVGLASTPGVTISESSGGRVLIP